AGAQLLALPPTRAGQVDLPALMQALAAREINEVHSEAGARLNGALLAAGLADEVLAYVAPVLLGDAARAACVLPQYAALAQAPRLHNAQWRAVGEDMRLLAHTATGAQFARGDYGQ
ncbi:MAG: dihydrofolate reductase family protein, partial [Rhodocyclaceae bacterium]|nr:dihydrofolate reductase family protein [Rhodocyclaceae bacterium]